MYNVVIVDDEEVARLRLKRLITENFGDFKIIAEASNGNSGIEIIQNTKPDLVFLDIKMPQISGIEIARSCCKDIFVIFVTAYEQYVFDAFKTLAVDYILKPITVEDLRAAIDKFHKIINPSGLISTTALSAGHMGAPYNPGRLKVSIGNTIKFVAYNEVIYFDSHQKYTTVYTSDLKNYIVDKSLQELEETLPSSEFIRIYRKYIVNKSFISGIKRIGDRKYKVLLKKNVEKELLVGRHYLSNLKNLE